jgi:predicted transcriptional regulator
MPRQPTIGNAELEILRFIHDHPGATVRDVARHFSKTHGHVRTTVLNVMEGGVALAVVWLLCRL